MMPLIKQIKDTRPETRGRPKGSGAWRNSVLVVSDKEELEELKALDTMENMRLVALSVALDEDKFVQARISAMKFLYPNMVVRKDNDGKITYEFERVENADVPED